MGRSGVEQLLNIDDLALRVSKWNAQPKKHCIHPVQTEQKLAYLRCNLPQIRVPRIVPRAPLECCRSSRSCHYQRAATGISFENNGTNHRVSCSTDKLYPTWSLQEPSEPDWEPYSHDLHNLEDRQRVNRAMANIATAGMLHVPGVLMTIFTTSSAQTVLFSSLQDTSWS